MKAGFIWSLVCGSLFASSADAADVFSPMTPETKPTAEAGWTFSVTPYFWAAGLSGETSQFGLPIVDIDSSFSDILEDLDFGAMAIAEARYDRYSIFGDLIYAKISSGSGTREVSLQQV